MKFRKVFYWRRVPGLMEICSLFNFVFAQRSLGSYFLPSERFKLEVYFSTECVRLTCRSCTQSMHSYFKPILDHLPLGEVAFVQIIHTYLFQHLNVCLVAYFIISGFIEMWEFTILYTVLQSFNSARFFFFFWHPNPCWNLIVLFLREVQMTDIK